MKNILVKIGVVILNIFLITLFIQLPLELYFLHIELLGEKLGRIFFSILVAELISLYIIMFNNFVIYYKLGGRKHA